ncbi:MAG TPA: hypothetical protein VGR20_21440 [Acidimicrobiia bacterium]|nr:hypothetical protein [Acidimicrobiia bacterium]
MRIWGHLALGGIAVLTSSFAITVPAGAAPSHPGGVSDTCPEVLAGAPTGGMEEVTDPPDGSEVRRGAVVAVTLRWDTTTFAGSVLHKALDCVTIDGTPADQLSTQERGTANDGSFEYRFTVPGDLAEGARLCDRGFVSGPGADNGFDREKSNDVCFIVRGDVAAETSVPAETGSVPESPAPSSPSSPSAPAETPSSDSTVDSAPPSGTSDVAQGPVPLPVSSFAAPVSSPAPITAGPAGRGTPGTEVTPASDVLGEQRDILPRTGSTVDGQVRLAAITLLLGGTCLLIGRRRDRTVSSSGGVVADVRP